MCEFLYHDIISLHLSLPFLLLPLDLHLFLSFSLPPSLPPPYLPTFPSSSLPNFFHHFTANTTSFSSSSTFPPVGAMMIDTWLFLIGGIMMTLASNVYWLIPARLIIGFASGLASVVVRFLSLNVLKVMSLIRLL